MAELADALDLGSSGYPRAGSSPVIRTIKEKCLCRRQGCFSFIWSGQELNLFKFLLSVYPLLNTLRKPKLCFRLVITHHKRQYLFP